MEEIEKFFLTSYEKVLQYLNGVWQDTLASIETFDFTIVAKVSIIILFGYLLAQFLSKHIPKLIQTVGHKIHFPVDNELIVAIRSFMFKLLFFLFLLLAITTLTLPENIAFIAFAIIKSIILLSFIGFALKISKLLLYKMANTPREEEEEVVRVIQPSTLPLFENTILIIFSIAGIYQVLAIWNVDMTALLAGAGIGAMAIGMAAKDTLSDIIAGILILTDAPYRVGDVVYVRDNLKGRVSEIGLRNTRIVTRNNIEVIIPNTIMGTSQIVNESSSKENGIRINIDISVSNNEDIHQVKLLLLQAVAKSKEVNQNKKKKAIMLSFAMDMLQFRVQCWIDDPERKGDAKAELMENIYLTFKEAEIDITLRRYQHVKVSYEEPQELHIKEFPDIKQEQYVKEFPDTKQEQYVKEFPDTKQEQYVKEFPDTKQEVEISKLADSKQVVYIKEVPNLFGKGSVTKLTKVSKNPMTKKGENEK